MSRSNDEIHQSSISARSASETAHDLDLSEGLDLLVSSELDTVFRAPSLVGKPSAWWTHVPFAFWVMTACRPKLFVELGSHYGVSYAAFCDANLLGNQGAQCIAVDTWRGDEHAGFYGDAVYDGLRAFNESRYSAFSTLLRSTFHDALDKVADGSVDLLHIDGRHRYEDVREDFEGWRPKLSERAVVLFHDTNVREGDFGVYRFFDEIRAAHPTFEFLHGSGLGVAVVGASPPVALARLCSLKDPKLIGTIRSRFSYLGSTWLALSREQLGNERHAQDLAAQQQAHLHEIERYRNDFESTARRTNEELESARAELQAARRIRDRAAQRLVALRQTVETLAQARARDTETPKAAALPSLVDEAKYRAAFDDPGTSIRSRVAKRVAMTLGRLGRRKLLDIEGADAVRRSPFFDRVWYASTYPDVAFASIDPATHYFRFGYKEGRDPGPHFSTNRYLALHADVQEHGVNPLAHYEMRGRAEGRSPGAQFQTAQPQPMNQDAALVALPRASLRRTSPQPSILWVSFEADTPGQRYRVTRYIEAAKLNDAAADWVHVSDLAKAIPAAQRCDVLVLWRVPWGPDAAQIVSAARSGGAKIVFDVDDLMVDPDLAKPEIIDGIRSQGLTANGVRDHYAAVRKTMLEADFCSTTTEELAFHMRWAAKPTFILPNGFDQSTHDVSLRAAQAWSTQRDGLTRIGYAGGSRTHQKDFELALPGVVATLKRHAECRLVLFRTKDGLPLIDIEEFPTLAEVAGQIEWRPLQMLEDLPNELARFDINLAPLEFGNAFCEAKSELKFFEAALVGVPTVTSPTGPFLRAIVHGETGYLAAEPQDWVRYIENLASDAALRRQMASRAYLASLQSFGPRSRMARFGAVLDQYLGGARAARSFALAAARAKEPLPLPTVYPSDTVFEKDKGGIADVTVIVPLYNYEQYIVEALDSVKAQTLRVLDLVIVDGHSTDKSLAVAGRWARANADRFNRIVVLRNQSNYGLGPCRNSGFAAARSSYVLPLDADNRLRADCCEKLLSAIKGTVKAYVYPTIAHFGASSALISNLPYSAQRFAMGNYIDAMALVSKEAWAMVGGYNHVRFGWEDYDLWCRFAEAGLSGEWVDAILADYRVHAASMMTQQTTVSANYRALMTNFERRHPWVGLVDRARTLAPAKATATASAAPTRLDDLLSILRCPKTGQKLTYGADGKSLISLDRTQSWPVVEGRPALAPELSEPEVRPVELISNEVPETALDIIRRTKGWVLNLSAGGSAQKYDNVVEVEYAVFRHTDVLADAHHLPFDDASFDAVISMNAFEHYRDPPAVAAELLRVLKPGGVIHVRTAFLQPLHEKPWHFFNCTRYGMKVWFEDFIEEKLHVSPNFSSNHTISWLASESEASLRRDVSAEAAETFSQASVGDFVRIWRNPAARDTSIWRNFDALSQDSQEITAAGFEFVGRKPTEVEDGARRLKR